MIQLAWLWLQHQPGSALSIWFRERVQRNGGRGKKTAIVAMARKLLIALWKYAAHGVLIEGAVAKNTLKKAENATVIMTKPLIFHDLESAARNFSVFP